MSTQSLNVTSQVRRRIDHGGERVWRFADFDYMPQTAVAQALSRLARQGVLNRLSKGVYYRGRTTPFGASQPNPSAIQQLASKRAKIFPAGMAAANLLGFSTQSARQGEVATVSGSLPRKLVGHDTIIHTRRPAAWQRLSEKEAALLDFLRSKGATSELTPDKSVRRLLKLLAEDGCYAKIMQAADTEPPRVRAILGAAGQEIGAPRRHLDRLRKSLNPLSRFNFGILASLRHAESWQAKGRPG